MTEVINEAGLTQAVADVIDPPDAAALAAKLFAWAPKLTLADLLAEWRRLGEEPPQTPFQVAYRAGIRKCADELEYALAATAPATETAGDETT